MPRPRHLTEDEKRLITTMLRDDATGPPLVRQLDDLLVTDMDDGGMGSLLFAAVEPYSRCLGLELAEAAYADADGISVSVVLNLDQHHALFELDSFKADNSRLIRIPAEQDIYVLPKPPR